MIELPKLTGREFRPWDWYGWFMSFWGIALTVIYATNNTITWTHKILVVSAISFITLEYIWRVAYGRVYKHVYYDTIIHHMYEVKILDDTYYICAATEDELKLYLDLHYPLVGENYTIVNQAEVESFIKKELFE